MSKPKVSIVMPTMNSVKFVRHAIDSVVRQSFDEWELVVMDGGSIDGTIEAVKSFAHPNIRLFSEPDHGSYHAFIKGFDRAYGDYLMGLPCSDGFVDDDWLRLCVDALDSDSQVSLVWGVPVSCTEDGKVGGPHVSFAQFLRRSTLAGWFWRALKSKCRGQIPERLVRKLFRLGADGASNPLIVTWTSRMLLRKLFRFGADDVQKQDWFDYWLDTLLCFPDGNMCFRRIVYDQCMPKVIQGGRAQDDYPQFFFNFNQMGFLPLCIPRIANFGRTHANNVGSVFRSERQLASNDYYRNVRKYEEEVRTRQKTHYFRDGSGKVIGQW